MASAIFQPAAEAELKDAYAWYEEIQTGLGTEFLTCVENCVRLLQLHPEMFPVIHKNVRQAVLRRFPYSILYLPFGENLTVISVFHASRNPMVWKRRARFQ